MTMNGVVDEMNKELEKSDMMKLKISLVDLNEVIRAVKTCPTIKPDEIERIVSPIREQLGLHIKWGKRKQAVWDYVNGGYKVEKDVTEDIFASECPYKLEPQEDMHVINTYFDDDGTKHTKEYYTGIDRNTE